PRQGALLTPRAPCAGAFVVSGPVRPPTPAAARHEDRGRRAMARPDKTATVAELSDKFRTSSAAVLTEYRGLTVSQLTQLRRSIGGHATYSVVKNTLTAIAARDAGVTALDEAALA